MALKLDWLFIKRSMYRRPAVTAAFLVAHIPPPPPRPSPHGSLPRFSPVSSLLVVLHHGVRKIQPERSQHFLSFYRGWW